MKQKKQTGSVRPACVNLSFLQPLSSQVEHFLRQEAQHRKPLGEDVHVNSPGMHWMNPTLTRHQILTFVQACKIRHVIKFCYIKLMYWSESNCTGRRHWPLVLWSFKFLIYGRRDDHYQVCLDKQKVFCIELFDKVYFKDPIPGLLPRNYFLKECHLRLTLVLSRN